MCGCDTGSGSIGHFWGTYGISISGWFTTHYGGVSGCGTCVGFVCHCGRDGRFVCHYDWAYNL
jgi:hypothetical protein